jgi:hypothetical protein
MGSNFRNYLNTFVFDTVLPGSGEEVSFKPITTGQIKKLLLYETSDDPMTIENALDDVIMECIVKPQSFDIKKLYIQDRFYLLVELRKATRGSVYNFQSICTSCKSQTQHSINLNDLKVKTLKKTKQIVEVIKKDEDIVPKKQKKGKFIEKIDEETKPQIVINTTNEWDVVKLNENISVKLTLVTRELQQKAFDLFTELYKDKENINDVERTLEITTFLYALSIVDIITPDGVDTDLPIEEKIFFLDNLQQDETEKISKWFEENDFGIDFTFEAKCRHCENVEVRSVPLENFFY